MIRNVTLHYIHNIFTFPQDVYIKDIHYISSTKDIKYLHYE